MGKYKLLVLHKLDESYGYYDVSTGRNEATIKTLPFPHEICLDPARKKIYIAEMGVRGIESAGPGGHTIAVFDLKSGKQVSTIDTGKYDRPQGIVTYGKKLFVTSESTKNLLVYDIDKEILISAVCLGQDCAHMVNVSPDGKVAYTANIWSNSITAVDTEKYSVLHNIDLPERPEGLVFSADGKTIYCVCREARSVAVINRDKAQITGKIETGNGPVRISITPDGKELIIPLFHSGTFQIADTRTEKVTATVEVGPHPAGICLSPDGSLAFISCEEENLVYVFNLASREIINRIKTGNGADAMLCVYAEEVEN